MHVYFHFKLIRYHIERFVRVLNKIDNRKTWVSVSTKESSCMKMNYNLADIDLEYLFGEISHQRRCFIGIRSLQNKTKCLWWGFQLVPNLLNPWGHSTDYYYNYCTWCFDYSDFHSFIWFLYIVPHYRDNKHFSFI